MKAGRLIGAAVLSALPAVALAQTSAAPLTPTPKGITTAELAKLSALDRQLVRLNGIVIHTDTAQAFTLGQKDGVEVHVLVPQPANDAAHVGDTVTVVGFVRRYRSGDFERDFPWFRRADYPHVSSGDWVIVAISVRTPEGTELVPPNTISSSPPPAK